MHYYKFNIADWSLGTSHLSLVEEAIYFRLINFYYDTEQPIPLETQSVFRRLRMGSESVVAQQIIDEFFVKTDSGYIHERCDKIIAEYKKTEKKNKKNGAKGGRPRKDAACKETQEKPSGLSVGTQEEPKHNPNQEPLTINQKPLTTLKDITPSAEQEKPAKKVTSKLDYSSWPTMPSEQIMQDWLAMRKRLKANVSQTVINRFASELRKAATYGYTVDQCLAECVTRNWRGFEVQWILNSKQPTGGHNGNQPKQSLIDRFIQNNYGPAQDDNGPMGCDDRVIRGEVVQPVRRDAGRIGPMETDLIGDFKAKGGSSFE